MISRRPRRRFAARPSQRGGSLGAADRARVERRRVDRGAPADALKLHAERSSRSSIARRLELVGDRVGDQPRRARAISSRTTRLFSRSVVPVAVRSTIASTSPVSGASSTEPLTSTISTCRPVRSKCARRRADTSWRRGSRPGAAAPPPPGPGRRSSRRPSCSGRSRGRAARRRRGRRARRAGRCLLHEHVLAGDADVGRAGGDVGRDVGGAHRDQADVLEEQLAVVVRALAGGDAEPLEPVERLLEERAARNRDRQAGRCRSRAQPALLGGERVVTRSTSSAKPTAGRARPNSPSRSS